MKKQFFFILFLILSVESYAQCPISVNIVSIPDVSTIPVCKSTPVQLEANASVGAIGPQYIWVVDGDTIIGADSIINILANSQSIVVYMQTSTGCPQDTVSFSIQVETVLIQSSVEILNSSCDLTNADIKITSTGGTSPYSYNLLGIGTSTTGLYNNVPVGTYTLYVTDDQGCNDTNQITVTPEKTIITSVATPLVTECNQTIVDIEITSTGGTPAYSYDLVGIGTSSDGSYSDVPVGSYTLYTTDSQGCTDTNIVVVTPYDCPPPMPTDRITPNEDGLNDMWRINNIQFYPDNEVFIFDRWGQRVYHDKEYDNLDGWQAKYVGVDMPVSTYYYILKIYLEKSDDMVFKGAISVFR